MRAVRLVWDEYLQETKQKEELSFSSKSPTILFTTESTAMVEARQSFVANHSNFPFPIASNFLDVTPDTGDVASLRSNASPDESLLSAFVTLKFQLLAPVTLGNCCSNFHVMLGDLMAAQCGAAPSNRFYCLNKLEDPSLRICCTWSKGCQQGKLKALNEWNVSSLNFKSLAVWSEFIFCPSTETYLVNAPYCIAVWGYHDWRLVHPLYIVCYRSYSWAIHKFHVLYIRHMLRKENDSYHTSCSVIKFPTQAPSYLQLILPEPPSI